MEERLKTILCIYTNVSTASLSSESTLDSTLTFKDHRSKSTIAALAMAIHILYKGLSIYLPPQLKDLERSFPVPSGIIPRGGLPLGKVILSITESIQAAVPSPPHAEKNNETFYAF